MQETITGEKTYTGANFFREGTLRLIHTSGTAGTHSGGYQATAETASILMTNMSNVSYIIGVADTFGDPDGSLYIENLATENGIKINPNISGNHTSSFTGFHRAVPEEGDGNGSIYLTGVIVESTGVYNNPNSKDSAIYSGKPNISESVPVIKKTSTANSKKVFGVIASLEEKGSDLEDKIGSITLLMGRGENSLKQDTYKVNSLGEGAIWVSNYNGNLENGDYITTSVIPGIGMKQDDDLLHNYTVAKITQDCNFNTSSSTYDCETFTHNGTTYKKAFVGCTYHCG